MATTPVVINSVDDLQAIQNKLSGYYVLGANIDASGFNFLPIGSAANPFTGIFDGQGHTISNLTIHNVSNTDAGLFGDIGTTGTVSNVGLINESVTSSYSNVGGLVGTNFGTVSQSYVTGNVSGATLVGALVGFNGASGSIARAYATGTANGQIAGGLVGVNDGAISDSYATGSVNYFRVSLEAGGLVGLNGGSITQCYATGLVGLSGGFVFGGLVAVEVAGSVTVSYWDTETTGRSISGGGTGLTTAELQSGVLPAGFDPTVWSDIAGQFPELRWQVSNHPPVASNIFANANEDTNDPIVKLHALFTDADLSDTFTFSTDRTGTIGKVTNNNDGTFTYDPNGKFESLGIGETATDTFKYTVTDNHGASSTATATVTIHGENDAPIALPDVATVQKGGTVTGNVRTNDFDPDTHDVLHISKVNGLDFNVGQAIHGTYGTLTLNVNGSYTYVANQSASPNVIDHFSYTVDDGHHGNASSTLDITIQSGGAIQSSNKAGLLTAAKVFANYGLDGEMVVLARLADDSYHLASHEPKSNGLTGTFTNNYDAAAEAVYQSGLPSGLRFLTTADLPLGLHVVSDPNFPITGLEDGIYHNSNAAALIARSADSLFIAFRGTNDVPAGVSQTQLEIDVLRGVFHDSPYPDVGDWTGLGMRTYAELLQPLISAVDAYISNHPEIQHVYVTGHSLGGGTAQSFMYNHQDGLDPLTGSSRSGLTYDAITFGTSGYPEFSADGRVLNIINHDDPLNSIHLNRSGDLYEIDTFNPSLGSITHSMQLYYDEAAFFSKNEYLLPSAKLAINGITDTVKLWTNITYQGSDTWTVEVPRGIAPSNVILNSAEGNIMHAAPDAFLVGGPSSDTFIFQSNFGNLSIEHFDPKQDVLQFDHSIFGNPNAVMSHAINVGNDVLVAGPVSGETVTLLGIHTSQLDPAHNFLIV